MNARMNLFPINNRPPNTLLQNSPSPTNPISKTKFSDPISIRFDQIRSFSSHPTAKSKSETPQIDIDAGSSIRKPVILCPGMCHSPVTNALWEARSRLCEQKMNDNHGDLNSKEMFLLEEKNPSYSRTRVIYKFSSDFVLREQYRNPWNEMRTGKLLEDLDGLAGTISYKHCFNEDSTARPLLLVTASVDKIKFKKPIRIDTDLTIVGTVTWVGRSSMETQIEVAQDTDDSSDPIALVANFTFVARDSRTGKAAPINHISPETEREKILWIEAEERIKARKMKRRQQNTTEIKNDGVGRLKALLGEGRVFCDMPALADRDSRDTCLESSLVCQPQQRNIHGQIFGGYLMRKAAELAFSTTYAFAGVAPRFKEVDRVEFLKPVDVGDFLRLKSRILYTELENPVEPLINVEVEAHVTQPEIRSSEVSNKFLFKFSIRPEAMADGFKIRNAVPSTEDEAQRVLALMDAET